jgi:hypothetical protein
VTDYTVAEGDPFLTMTTTITNGCAGTDGQLGSFLDAVIWTQRGIVPFSAGAGTLGGRGFDHPILDFANPATALETPSFVGAPGMLSADDGVMDPANGTVSSALAYGILPVRYELDSDGPGGVAPPVVAGRFALRRVEHPRHGDGPCRSARCRQRRQRRTSGASTSAARATSGRSATLIIPELAVRRGFLTAIAGNVYAADPSDVAASVLVTRVGVCTGNHAIHCRRTPPVPARDRASIRSRRPASVRTARRRRSEPTRPARSPASSSRRATTDPRVRARARRRRRGRRDGRARGHHGHDPADVGARARQLHRSREDEGQARDPREARLQGRRKHGGSALQQVRLCVAGRRGRAARDVRRHAARPRQLGARGQGTSSTRRPARA